MVRSGGLVGPRGAGVGSRAHCRWCHIHTRLINPFLTDPNPLRAPRDPECGEKACVHMVQSAVKVLSSAGDWVWAEAAVV